MRKENDKSAAEKEELFRKVEELKLINKNSEKELKRRGLQKQVLHSAKHSARFLDEGSLVFKKKTQIFKLTQTQAASSPPRVG